MGRNSKLYLAGKFTFPPDKRLAAPLRRMTRTPIVWMRNSSRRHYAENQGGNRWKRNPSCPGFTKTAKRLELCRNTTDYSKHGSLYVTSGKRASVASQVERSQT